ncbi:hypothetical protein CRM22_001206 [Opisthorchis felineus]|uniref:G-protein coupled receptors family 1 profile domain-containing protein n=1 Tax=Opisthorchis felineus TaxID=147828 RepID=A0A4S2MBR9_OPIFE|nr:hypothetical protein CRM22_001206 [Opisthorchis felineus]
MIDEDCRLNTTSKHVAESFRLYVFSWYWITANLVAAACSILCLLVLVRHPRVFAASTRTWFIALIVSDVFILMISANDMYAELMFPKAYHLMLCRVFGRFTAQIRIGTITCLLWISNFLQTGLSVERLASILSPLRTRALSTGRLTRFVILGLVLFCCVTAIVLSVVTLKPDEVIHNYNNLTSRNEVICQMNRRHLLDEQGNIKLDAIKISYCVDLIIMRAIPFSMMLISSTLIALLIRRQRKQRTKLMCSTGAAYSSNTQNRESRASLLLLTMNLTTLLTNPLFLLFELLDGEGSEGQRVAKLTGDPCISCILRQFFNCLLYVNNQTNWVFYLTFGARFRLHIRNLLRCKDTSSTRSGHSRSRSKVVDRFAHVVSGTNAEGSNSTFRSSNRSEPKTTKMLLKRAPTVSRDDRRRKEFVQPSGPLDEEHSGI